MPVGSRGPLQELKPDTNAPGAASLDPNGVARFRFAAVTLHAVAMVRSGNAQTDGEARPHGFGSAGARVRGGRGGGMLLSFLLHHLLFLALFDLARNRLLLGSLFALLHLF